MFLEKIASFDFKSLIPYFVVYGPTVLFILIILLSTILGYFRGLKKSGILFFNSMISFGIIIVIFIILTNQNIFNYQSVKIVNNIMGENYLQNKLNVSSERNSLVDILIEFLLKNNNNAFISIITDSGAYVVALAQALLRAIVAISLIPIYFLLIFILYIFYLIFRKESRRRKKHNELFSLREEAHTYAPFKSLGAVVGLVRGLIAGFIFLAIIGAPLYLVFNDSKDEYKNIETNNEVINQNQYIFKELSVYGNSGIYQLLNGVKNKNGIPYYLFIADVILQGNLDDKNLGVNKNVYFYKELVDYREFTNNSIKLLVEYVDEDFYTHIKDNNQQLIWSDILKVFYNIEFQERFSTLFEDFDKGSYIIDLTYSLIQSFIKYIDELGIENEAITEPLKILFKENYRSKYIKYEANIDSKSLPHISVKDLIKKDDLDDLLNIFFKCIATYNSMDKKDQDISFIMSLIKSLSDDILNLSLFYSKDNTDMINKSFRRLYSYLINVYLNNEEKDFESICYDTKFDNSNWILETKQLVSSIPHLMTIYQLKLANVEINNSNFIDVLFSLKDEDVQVDYQIVRDSLFESSLFESILQSGYVNDILKNSLSSSFENFSFPKEDNYLMTLKILDHLIDNRNNLNNFKYIMNNSLTDDNYDTYRNSFNEIIDQYMIDNISNANLIISIFTQILMKNDFIYIDNLLFNKDSDGNYIYILSNNEMYNLLSQIDYIFDIARPFIKGLNDFSEINNIINSNQIDNVLKSKVLEGTISKLLFENDSIKDSLIIPLDLSYTSIGATSEIKKLINSLRILNLDITKIQNMDFNTLYDSINKLDLSHISQVLDSDILYANSSYQIYVNAINYIDGLIIPNTVLDNGIYNFNGIDYSYIDRRILADFLLNISIIYKPSYTSEELIKSFLKNSSTLFLASISKDIFITSAAYMLVNNDQIKQMINDFEIPQYFINNASMNILKYQFSDSNPWYKEVYYLMINLIEITDCAANDYVIDYNNIQNIIESNIKTLNLPSNINNSISKINLLYSSNIISYNLSNKIVNLLSDNNICKREVLESPLIMKFNSVCQEYMIFKDELSNLIEAINMLNIDIYDSSSLNGLSIESLNYSENGLAVKDYVYNSYIARAIITKNINDQLNSANIKTTIGAYETLGNSYYEIYKAREIDSLLNIINDKGNLGDSYFDNLYLDDFLDYIFVKDSDEVKSYIILKALSDKIIDNANIICPKECYNTQYELINGLDVKLLLFSLEELGILSTDNISFNSLDLSKEFTYLYQSSIIRASLPNAIDIRYNGQRLDLSVIQANMKYVITKDYLDNFIIVMNQNEMKDFIDEIKVLGLGSTTATITVDSILNYISTSTNYKKSDIVYTFICNVIKNNPQIWITILYKYPTSTSIDLVIYNLTNYEQSRTTLYNIDKK